MPVDSHGLEFKAEKVLADSPARRFRQSVQWRKQQERIQLFFSFKSLGQILHLASERKLEQRESTRHKLCWNLQ